jgi:hypothetical protein
MLIACWCFVLRCAFLEHRRQQVYVTNGRLCSDRETHEVQLRCCGMCVEVPSGSHASEITLEVLAQLQVPLQLQLQRRLNAAKQIANMQGSAHKHCRVGTVQCPTSLLCSAAIVTACHLAPLHLCSCVASAACQRSGASQNTGQYAGMVLYLFIHSAP